jgi:hypothetical protein
MGRRLPVGPLLAALGALVLLVSLFLDWYADVTAWTVFEVLDLVLAGLALFALLSLARELGFPRAGMIGAGALLPLAAAAFLIVVSQLLNHPPARNAEAKGTGIWLAFGATAVMLAGAILASARISLALDVERRDDTAPTRPVPGEDRPPAAGPRP